MPVAHETGRGAAHCPVAPAQTQWDVVIVGTGMGGATLGYALARRGLRVLWIEKGRFLLDPGDRGDGVMKPDADESPPGRLQRGWWPLQIDGRTTFGQRSFFAPLGCGTGGTTGLYAAQLERLSPLDFAPRAQHLAATDSSLPERWPITYEEMAGFYREAEQLYRVTGTQDPLQSDPAAQLRTPPPLSARDEHLSESFSSLGLHPYRAHCGFEFVPGCEECSGALCPRSCKADAGRISLLPALEQHGAKILVECEALELEHADGKVTGVRCSWRGEELVVRGNIVVLAAGSLMSPTLLLRSARESFPEGLANSSGEVGRNLMFHVSDFVAVRPNASLPEQGPRKALALNDFYVHEGRKLGTLQSVGASVNWRSVLYYLRNTVQNFPRVLRKLLSPFLRIAAYIGGFYFRRSHVFALVLEDLPYSRNRVLHDPQAKNGMRFEYDYPEELRERSRLFRRVLKRVVGRRHRCFVLTGDHNLNYGHACGTCRFGDDPKTSVLDRNNRTHDVSNLYVVDGSFFPSSGGTNPSLTIAANALRVSRVIERELGGPANLAEKSAVGLAARAQG